MSRKVVVLPFYYIPTGKESEKKSVYNVPPEIAGSVTLSKVSLTVQYIQLEQIHKVPEKSERCITILLRVVKE